MSPTAHANGPLVGTTTARPSLIGDCLAMAKEAIVKLEEIEPRVEGILDGLDAVANA